MSTTAVNAYYASWENEIVLLAGYLQPPLFDVDYPLSYTLGAAGFIVGHEIMHGFDTKGSKFDVNGNKADWFTDEFRKKFVSRADCLARQYSKLRLHGEQIDGNLTLAEDMADNEGLRAAFQAYLTAENAADCKTCDEALPGLDLTARQLFFVGSAQPWCSKHTPAAAKSYLEDHRLGLDDHSFDRFRVDVPLSNSDGFRSAFKCPVGSAMAPEQQCHFW